MPQKNAYKEYIADSYYHIFNRGVNKQDIFIDEDDFAVFLGLLKRYLGDEIQRKPNRESQANYYLQVELLAFCLMPNHFHIFIYQTESYAITNLMKSLGVAYGMYFNKKYRRVGPVFQQRYKAVRIINDSQLLHITRYIHMNPQDYEFYQWSSLPYYIEQKKTAWLRPTRVLNLFEGGSYLKFLDEYKNKRDDLKKLRHELADS